jgi:hypothetical protein
MGPGTYSTTRLRRAAAMTAAMTAARTAAATTAAAAAADQPRLAERPGVPCAAKRCAGMAAAASDHGRAVDHHHHHHDGVAITMAWPVASAGTWPRRPPSPRRSFYVPHVGLASTRGARSAHRVAAATGRACRRGHPPPGGPGGGVRAPPTARHLSLCRAPRAACLGPISRRPRRRAGPPLGARPRAVGGRSLLAPQNAGEAPQWQVLSGPTRPTKGPTDAPAGLAGPRESLGD